MSKEQIFTTVLCQFCHGDDQPKGYCRKFGLKFRNSICIPGELTVKYKQVRVRNDVPWWKFWKRHYAIEKHVVEAKTFSQRRAS